MIKKQIKYSQTQVYNGNIYLPILLTEEAQEIGSLTDYGDTDLKRYTPENSRVLITGYCESKLSDIEIYGVTLDERVGAFNFVGEQTTPSGEVYNAYSGIISKTNNTIVYVLNCKLNPDNTPNERYGIVYTDKTTTRSYYNDIINTYDTITETTFRTYSYGLNKLNSIYNPNQYKDEKNNISVEPLKVDSSEMVVDRYVKQVFEKHMLLATAKNINNIK